MYKVFTCCFLCGCSTYVWFHLLGLRRGSGCWWWLPSPSPIPRWEFFPVGFRCCPLRSFPCALVLQGLPPWGVVVQGNSGGITFFCPLSLGSHSHCQLSHPLSCVGGGRERELLSIIIMHSCNPNDRLDLWLYSHCWANVNLCFRRLCRSSYVGLGV